MFTLLHSFVLCRGFVPDFEKYVPNNVASRLEILDAVS